MTTVTTERLKQIASGNAFTCTQDDESASMAAELLAVREAQSVEVSDKELNDALRLHYLKTEGHSQLADSFRNGFKYARRTAPPAPAVPGEVKKVLLWALWHHQGGNSDIGQPIRQFLGIDQYSHLSPAQLDIAKAYPASMAEKRVIRDGYTLVPVEPTAEMIQSGIAAHHERQQLQIHDQPAPGPMECAYIAMLAAAPTPTKAVPDA